ncbi:MAG: serine/threonine-protein kinase, partial [Planctomycetota bacterium]
MTIASRLRQQCGKDVDPRIDLDPVGLPHAAKATPPPLPSSSSSSAAAPTLARLGGRAGSSTRYQLQGEIARGGMGAILEVFDEDLRRRLAMKVILDRSGDGSGAPATDADPVTLSRFLEEAQVTGQLDHPCIVPVHELGLDDHGRVYFTMRLVHGRHLEAVFDLAARGAEDWTTMRALSVLHKVCEAMAYAHEKGVVHRDLKPQNVMVGRFGEVYVMDWGLARVRGRSESRDARIDPDSAARDRPGLQRVETDRRDASSHGNDDGLYTMDGDIVGTPSYMSPEQARGELEQVDERSDVYSVGAMLYRLLAGVAPHAGERSTAIDVWKRVVAGPPPALDTIAKNAPPELVAVCEKAMARDPAQRYQGMLELASDLRAFLENRVVRAFETGAVAEARKWVRRNRGLAASLAGFVLALAGGLVTSLVLADRAHASADLAEVRRGEAARSAELAEAKRKEAAENAALAEERRKEAAANAELAEQRRSEADANATLAKQQARIAKEVNSFLNDDLFAAIAPEHDGKDVTVRQVLDRASTQLDIAGLGSDPEVEAALRMTMGTTYQRLGEPEISRRHFERALELGRTKDGDRSETVLEALRGSASALLELGQHDEAIAHYQEALAMSKRMFGDEHKATLSTMTDLAIVLEATGRTTEAEALRSAAIPMQAKVFGEDAPDTLASRNNQGLAAQRSGRFAEAEQILRDVLERRIRVSGARHPETVVVTSNLAMLLGDLGRLDEGEALAREVLDACLEIYDEDHPKVANAMGNLGTLAFRRGRMQDAERLFRESLRIRLLRQSPDQPEVLQAKHNLAASIFDPSRIEESLTLRREVLEARTRVLGADHVDTLAAMHQVGAALREANRLDEAEATYRDTLARRLEVLGQDHPETLITRENLAGVLFAKKDHAGSEAMTREVLEARRRVLGDDHPDVAKTMLNLAIVQRGRGDVQNGVANATEALARSREAFGDTHVQIATCLRTLGDLHADATDWPAASASYRDAIAACRRLRPDDSEVGYLLHQSAYVKFQEKDHAAAMPLAEEAVALRERVLGKEAVGTRVSLFLVARILGETARLQEAETMLLDLVARAKQIVGLVPLLVERDE